MNSTKEEWRAVTVTFLRHVRSQYVSIFQWQNSQVGDAYMTHRTFYNWVGRYGDSRTRIQSIPPSDRTPYVITPTRMSAMDKLNGHADTKHRIEMLVWLGCLESCCSGTRSFHR